MAFTGYAVRVDKDGVEWYRRDGTEQWFRWQFADLDEVHVTVQKVYGTPEWPESQART